MTDIFDKIAAALTNEEVATLNNLLTKIELHGRAELMSALFTHAGATMGSDIFKGAHSCQCGTRQEAALAGVKVAAGDHESACSIWYARVHLVAAALHIRATVGAKNSTMKPEEARAFSAQVGAALPSLTIRYVNETFGTIGEMLITNPEFAKAYNGFLDEHQARPTVVTQ